MFIHYDFLIINWSTFVFVIQEWVCHLPWLHSTQVILPDCLTVSKHSFESVYTETLIIKLQWNKSIVSSLRVLDLPYSICLPYKNLTDILYFKLIFTNWVWIKSNFAKSCSKANKCRYHIYCGRTGRHLCSATNKNSYKINWDDYSSTNENILL